MFESWASSLGNFGSICRCVGKGFDERYHSQGDAIIEEQKLADVDFSIPEGEPYLLRGHHPRFFAVTKSGSMNKELNISIIEKFQEVWHQNNPGKHCYLFSDQLASHMNVEMIRDALKDNVLLVTGCQHISLPPTAR
uniref:Uncharacterized protein n=1 Tax=Paramoeba aestuarina TaxID=180227 RepID=A0A7S4KZW4_9EUKA|mmetsp:Transcript_29026/g.44891  ORF Transcript_29026/g.44891 Transcript_29026/m.44891 type:complete len:137 (+) Transcript_29026:128-538(+)